MILVRFLELFDFIKMRSPYSEANKGKITDNIFIYNSSRKSKDIKSQEIFIDLTFYSRPFIYVLNIFIISSLSIFILGLLKKLAFLFNF